MAWPVRLTTTRRPRVLEPDLSVVERSSIRADSFACGAPLEPCVGEALRGASRSGGPFDVQAPPKSTSARIRPIEAARVMAGSTLGDPGRVPRLIRIGCADDRADGAVSRGRAVGRRVDRTRAAGGVAGVRVHLVVAHRG